MGHDVEDTGSENLVFLEMFKSGAYAGLSLKQWMVLTPHALVQAHTKTEEAAIDGLSEKKGHVV